MTSEHDVTCTSTIEHTVSVSYPVTTVETYWRTATLYTTLPSPTTEYITQTTTYNGTVTTTQTAISATTTTSLSIEKLYITTTLDHYCRFIINPNVDRFLRVVVV